MLSRLPLKVPPEAVWIPSRASSGIPHHMGQEKVQVDPGPSVGHQSTCCFNFLYVNENQSLTSHITFISCWSFLGMDLWGIGQDSARWEEHSIDFGPDSLCHWEPWRDPSIVWWWTIWKFPSVVRSFVVRLVQQNIDYSELYVIEGLAMIHAKSKVNEEELGDLPP